MTREEAIVWCDRFNNAWSNSDPEDDFPDLKYSDTLDQLFYLAGQSLRQQEQKRNAPLNLDELRQMDGEPVWVEFQDGSGGKWGIVHITMFNQIVFANGLHCTIGEPYYGKTWLAYRQKPEEGTT